MTVLQVCAYGAEYAGNFIASLEKLERTLNLRGVKTIYAFIDRAKDKEWCRDIQKRTKVYFLPEAKARILPKTYKVFRQIYKENEINIVHSHFELYDIPCTITAPKTAKVFWHLHDPITEISGLRGILWKLQYGYFGKYATLLAVADHYKNNVVKMGFPEDKAYTIVNGINTARIMPNQQCSKPEYDFLTFGWDFYRKGDDIILQACDRLEKEGYTFKLLLNGNSKTWPILDEYLNGRKPSYLVRCEPTDNINKLFDSSKVFIQASRRETFSYAVCEAAYSGLPVISSDIPGLEWAKDLPIVSFFKSENVDELYEIMKSFLEGKIVSWHDVNKSYEMINKDFTIDIWADKIIAYYEIKKH